jgi:hypothetical protein
MTIWVLRLKHVYMDCKGYILINNSLGLFKSKHKSGWILHGTLVLLQTNMLLFYDSPIFVQITFKGFLHSYESPEEETGSLVL